MIAVAEIDLPMPATGQRQAGSWMQVLSHLDPKYGGISTVVPSLAEALSGQGVQSGIAAFCAPGETYRPAALQPEAVQFWPISRVQWLRDAALRLRFNAEARRWDGLHIHGLWDATSATAAAAARRWNKPYVLSCHGMLEPWALNHGKLKKKIYAALVERKVVQGARCLHALTDAEAMQCRAFAGGSAPAVVIPNGVTIPGSVSPEDFLDLHPQLRGRRVVLFLARLHVKKGVDLLVRAWRRVVRAEPAAVLVIAGPDSDGLGPKLQEEVLAAGMEGSVLFVGMLSSTLKWSALAAAECMVLPSHSEGLSMSVLEAMGAGVPVAITPQCNMPWVERVGGGWLMEPTVDTIAATLEAVLGRSADENRQTGALAASFIASNYSWASVAARMAEVYRWCLGGNEPVLSEVIR